MSAHVEYRCDTCANAGVGRPDLLGRSAKPKGWHVWDGQHFCSYDCLIDHLDRRRRREATAQMFGRLEAPGGDAAPSS